MQNRINHSCSQTATGGTIIMLNERKKSFDSSNREYFLKNFQDFILRLNIGGTSYRIRTRSISKYGSRTLLGKFARVDHDLRKQWADWYFEESDEYFFERVPRYFDPIYDFYATGQLHVPKDLCFDKFMAELRFWAISRSKMNGCCCPFAQFSLLPNGQQHNDAVCLLEKNSFVGLRFGKLRKKLWRILEGQTSSKWWRVFEITSSSFVMLSVTALIVSSLPEFQVPEKFKDSSFTTQSILATENGPHQDLVEHPIFDYIEDVCVTYFILEYAVRFCVAPKKWRFVKGFLNIIDLLAVLPFLFEIILHCIGISGTNVRKIHWAFLTVRLLRILRIVRIAKLGRFSPGLANFALTLRQSKKQMQMVAIVMLTVVIFFSTLVYFLEKDEPNTTFISIPAAFWWAVVTMSTVGYGDSVPETIPGKLIGSGAIVCGVMVLALPITIMVNNFMQVMKLREERIVKKYIDNESVQ
ncbi:unnamed protein product [Thelazia callipaeda]|uniref:BTB domain-containing protein n=1 Tax=Thelazia callipaeda TaxID=103827 RepID=A0A0N5DAK1_THECL|nr:unnamed protein product [Thelazia callipaeda]